MKKNRAVQRNKRASLIAGLCLAASIATAAQAAGQGWYVGGTIGDTKAGDWCRGGAYSCDDTDTGYSLVAGYRWSQNLLLEGAYHDFGSVSRLYRGRESADLTALSVSGIGILPLSNEFGVFAKVGLVVAESDAKSQGVGHDDDSNLTALFGVGVRYLPNRNLELRAQYEVIPSFMDSSVEKSDVSEFSVGAYYHF